MSEEHKAVLKTMGAACRQVRQELGYQQMDVAVDTGYSVENVCTFEAGGNNNAILLSWYMNKANNILVGRYSNELQELA